MYLEHLYEIPTVIEDLDNVNSVLSHYDNFTNKLNNDCLNLDIGISWLKDINCSYFSNTIQYSLPRIGSVKNLRFNVYIDSVKIEFKIFKVESPFESEYTQGNTVAIPITKIALLKSDYDYLLVSLLDQNCCWLFKDNKLKA